MSALIVLAAALHAGDHITVATRDGQERQVIVRHIASTPDGMTAALEIPGLPDRTFPVRYLNTELVERTHEAKWAA